MKINPFIQKGVMRSAWLLIASSATAQIPSLYPTWVAQAEDSEVYGAIKSESGHTIGSFPVAFGSGSGSTAIALGSQPSVMGNASASTLTVDGNYSGGSGHSSLIYGFEIVTLGSGTATSIPIIVSATGSASFSAQGVVATGSASAEATWAVLSSDGRSSEGGGGRLGVIQVSPTQTAFASFNTNQSAMVSVGTLYGVFMSEDANASDGDLNSQAAALASVNSQVIIDPKFDQASSYQIIYANGVSAPTQQLPPQNQVAIPLVSTWVNLLYSGIPGRQYVVQCESSGNGPWTDLSGILTADPTGLVSYTDSRSPLPSSAIYRVRGTPP